MINCNVLAANILRLVGGESNVAAVVHCATRLRFKIVDSSKVKLAELAALDGVITVVNGPEQLQVVVGNRITRVYRAFGVISGLLDDGKTVPAQPQPIDSNSFAGRCIALVMAIFSPLLGAMAAAGVLKGLLAMMIAAGWLNSTLSTAIILHAASDSVFYFLPILLAMTCARNFNTNLYVAVAVAGVLVYPTIVGLFESGQRVTLFGLPVVVMKYTGSVLPIIFSVWLMSFIEQWLSGRIHEHVRDLVTPFILLTLMVPLTLLVIGPLGGGISQFVAWLLATLYNVSPIIASALMAAAWPMLILFGLHWGSVPVFLNDISVMGQSFLKAAAAPSIFALSGALLAVRLRTGNKKLKSLASNALIASLFGITEPGIYGVTLRLKKPFICAVIAAAFGGGVVGYAKSSAISIGMPGLLTLPVFYGEGFFGFIMGCTFAFIFSLALTLSVGFDERTMPPLPTLPVYEENNAPERKRAMPKPVSDTSEPIISPISGELIPLCEVNDDVFSTGIVGPGFAIIPDEGRVYSPVDGYIASTIASGHAIGISSKAGAEILIHVGINTVHLEGNYFAVQVKEGDEVKQGQLLLTFDLAGIQASGYDPVTPVIITNSETWRALQVSEKPRSRSGDPMVALTL